MQIDMINVVGLGHARNYYPNEKGNVIVLDHEKMKTAGYDAGYLDRQHGKTQAYGRNDTGQIELITSNGGKLSDIWYSYGKGYLTGYAAANLTEIAQIRRRVSIITRKTN